MSKGEEQSNPKEQGGKMDVGVMCGEQKGKFPRFPLIVAIFKVVEI